MLELGEEKPEDWWEIEALFDLAFGPGREALSSYRLRDGIDPVPGLSLILRDEEAIIGGAIRFWPVRVGGAATLLLGPVAVHPTRQGEGLGAYLIEKALERAVSLGWLRVLLVGDEPYYGRFGFHRLNNVEMPPPTNPARILGRALVSGAWEGVQGNVERADGTGKVA